MRESTNKFQGFDFPLGFLMDGPRQIEMGPFTLAVGLCHLALIPMILPFEPHQLDTPHAHIPG